MNDRVLALKWRPQVFGDLIGQNPITRTLINALSQQRFHRAYLFTGTRGVGKTTLARILAKCLNCDQGITPSPCRQCDNCVSIEQGHRPDVFEIDAASRTKIEDTRELLSTIPYLPVVARFKVYLIDEIHMLSQHSFNALLKTLEEPPPYVEFIFATTDPHKIPDTVLSRCLQCHLKPLSSELIENHLEKILNAETIPYEKAALFPIATQARGSLREALSSLDQAIGYGNGSVTVSAVQDLLGQVSTTLLTTLIHQLVQRDTQSLLKTIQLMAYNNTDFAQAVTDLLLCLHHLALLKTDPDWPVPLSEPDKARLLDLLPWLSPETLQLYYQIALIGLNDLPLAPDPQLGFEMLVLRLLSFGPVEGEPLPAQVPQRPIEATATSQMNTAPDRQSPPAQPPPVTPESPKPAPSSAPATQALSTKTLTSADWPALIPDLILSGMTLSLANHLSLETVDRQTLHFLLEERHGAFYNPKQKERLEKALSDHFQAPLTITVTVVKKNIASPYRANLAASHEKKSQVTQQLANDPQLETLLTTFSASADFQAVDTTPL